MIKPEPICETMRIMDMLFDVKDTATAIPDWEPTRAAALARLAAFLPHAGKHYAAKRNVDYGPQDRSNISCL
jgi:deoxyribodipyrimidine photolyase